MFKEESFFKTTILPQIIGMGLVIILLYGFISLARTKNEENLKRNIEEQEIIILTRDSILHQIVTSPKKDLVHILNILEIKHSEIVYAQAILETGHFTSKVCKEYNNLFGLYDSKNKCYYKFNHWIDSCIAYKQMIQNRYTGGDYYEFLSNIGYAEDPNYIDKIKQLVYETRQNNNIRRDY